VFTTPTGGAFCIQIYNSIPDQGSMQMHLEKIIVSGDLSLTKAKTIEEIS